MFRKISTLLVIKASTRISLHYFNFKSSQNTNLNFKNFTRLAFNGNTSVEATHTSVNNTL